MHGPRAAAPKVAWPDRSVPCDTAPVPSERLVSGNTYRVPTDAGTMPFPSADAPLAARVDDATADLVEELRTSLVAMQEDACAALERLERAAPAVATDTVEVRVERARRSRAAAVLVRIDVRRRLLTVRNREDALVSWLVDDDTIVARLPPGVETPLGGGVTVTANEGERALLVVRAHALRGESVVAVSRDLKAVDVRESDRPVWLGRLSGVSRSRQRRYALEADADRAGGGRSTRRSVPRPRANDGVAVPAGMGVPDAGRLDRERRRLGEARLGGDDPLGLDPHAFSDVPTFLAAVSERFLEGPRGARAVLAASPVLYAVLARHHGVSYATT